MRRIITISYTGLDAPGGVPAFNRALHAAFPDRECKHFCWEDAKVPPYTTFYNMNEWERAFYLNKWLEREKMITHDDIIVADGFWADGLYQFPLAISHSHGIWSHLTKEDVDAGKEPDMPFHHAAQVRFRKKWLSFGKPLTAVSNFISVEMQRQWGFKSTVIDNCVDVNRFTPTRKRFLRDKPIVVHGVNDKGNKNKGWDHIELLIAKLDAEVLSLDEMVEKYGGPKEWALAQADMMVHPSGYEGNSMFCLEAMSSGLPIVGYDVGYLFDYGTAELQDDVGRILDRRKRSPEATFAGVVELLEMVKNGYQSLGRALALSCSEEKFALRWRSYIEELECRSA